MLLAKGLAAQRVGMAIEGKLLFKLPDAPTGKRQITEGNKGVGMRLSEDAAACAVCLLVKGDLFFIVADPAVGIGKIGERGQGFGMLGAKRPTIALISFAVQLERALMLSALPVLGGKMWRYRCYDQRSNVRISSSRNGLFPS